MRMLVVILLLALTSALRADDPPTVPDVTRLQLEVASLKQQLALTTAQLQTCQAQVAPTAYQHTMTAIDTDVRAVVADFEQHHPGWTIDLKTGQPVKKGGK